MSDSLKVLEREISTAFKKRSQRFHRVSQIVKGAGIAGAGLIAAVAQFTMDMPDDATGIPWSRIIGIGASSLVFLGGLFVAFTESDASEELALAQNALSKAREVQEDYSAVSILRRRFENAVSSNIAQQTLAESLVERIGQTANDENTIVSEMMETVGHELSISSGFEQVDRWTIAVQRPHTKADGSRWLKPVAHKRAVDCPLDKARLWPIDRGVGGRAFQSAQPILVDDMTDPAVQSALGMESVDPETYRSIYADPIRLGDDEECWGIVIATSDQKGHFAREDGESQSHYSPLAQFTVMVKLALHIRRMSEKLKVQEGNLKPTGVTKVDKKTEGQ